MFQHYEILHNFSMQGYFRVKLGTKYKNIYYVPNNNNTCFNISRKRTHSTASRNNELKPKKRCLPTYVEMLFSPAVRYQSHTLLHVNVV